MDKDIKIGIKTTADTSGAKAAEEALKGVKKAGEEAAQEPAGFGRDTAAAKRIEALEAAEAVAGGAKKEAAALKELEKAAQDAAQALPDSKEADVVAESMERLGKATDGASGKKGGGGIAGMAGSLLRMLNPAGLITAAVTAGATAWWKWKKSLDDADEALVKAAENLAQSDRAYMENERRVAAAAESTDQLAAARRNSDIALGISIAELGNYARELERVMDLQKEERDFRDELLDEATRTALAGAEGDPVAQAEIRDNTRKAKQEQELADMDEDIISQKKIEDALNQEISTALEKKAAALEEASSLDDPIEEAHKTAKLAEERAAIIRKQQAEQLAVAEGLKGSKKSEAIREANRIGEGATTAEVVADKRNADVTALEQRQEAARKAAAELQKEIAEREKRNQETFDNRKKLERDRVRKEVIFDQRDGTSTVEMGNLQKREEEKRKAKADAAKEKAAREAEKRKGDQEKRVETEGSAARQALGAIPKDAPEKLSKAADRLAKGLQNGDQGGETAKLISVMEEIASIMEKRDTKASIKIDGILNRLKNLEGKK